MTSFHKLAVAAVTIAFGVAGCAQPPAGNPGHQLDVARPAGMPMAMDGTGAPMARMDEQINAMQAMHEKMMQAKTPEQRNALMADHMKVMQEGMAMMGSGGPGGMMGSSGMGAGHGGMPGMPGRGPMVADTGTHPQMMEKRMQMMQSMMQMMMDRMPPAATKP